jgi:hypothetical protein
MKLYRELVAKGVEEIGQLLASAKGMCRQLRPEFCSSGLRTVARAAEKVRTADSSRAEARSNDRNKGLIGTTEVVPCYKEI